MNDEMKRCVEVLRYCSSGFYERPPCKECPFTFSNDFEGDLTCVDQLMKNAADMIESLAAELEQAKRERDAAVADLKGMCDVCAHRKTCTGPWCGDCDQYDGCESPCRTCATDENWQWRGVKESSDA